MSLCWEEHQPLPFLPPTHIPPDLQLPQGLRLCLFSLEYHHARKEMPWVALSCACLSLGVWAAWPMALCNPAYVTQEKPTHFYRQG